MKFRSGTLLQFFFSLGFQLIEARWLDLYSDDPALD